MFNKFWEKAVYKAPNGEDSFGKAKYAEPVEIDARRLGGERLKITGDSTSDVYTYVYHLAESVELNGLLDGRIIRYCEPIRDVFGKTQFWEVHAE